MTLVYCPGITFIIEGWQNHSLVDSQVGVKLDSISPPNICTESSESHTFFFVFFFFVFFVFFNSGSDLINNKHCSGVNFSR